MTNDETSTAGMAPELANVLWRMRAKADNAYSGTSMRHVPCSWTWVFQSRKSRSRWRTQQGQLSSMQSRLMSAVETATNIAVGLVVSFMAQIVIFRLYDVHVTFSQNVEITLFFTAVSIVRSYVLRRVFNRMIGMV